jgi:hypothetical protein
MHNLQDQSGSNKDIYLCEFVIFIVYKNINNCTYVVEQKIYNKSFIVTLKAKLFRTKKVQRTFMEWLNLEGIGAKKTPTYLLSSSFPG